MNKKKYIINFLILVICFCYLNSFAQWQSDIRLTNSPASSLTSFNNAKCIASSGDTVHVVWSDERDGNSEIYYKRSIDGGFNWGNDLRLTNNSASSLRPAISLSGTFVFIVWEDSRNMSGYNTNIYFKYSSDGGSDWSGDFQLTNKSSRSDFPSVCVSGQTVNIAWEDNRDGNFEIYYKRSTDNGINWEADMRMTNDTANSFLTSVVASGQFLHMVWTDERDGNKEIYHKKSTDGGINWGTDTRLTNASGDSWYPSTASYGQDAYIVWREGRDGNSEIYFKRTTNGGNSWSGDIRLTTDNGESFNPSVSASGQNVHIVWRDSRDGNGEIYYKHSSDGGENWDTDLRLTNASGDSRFPSVSNTGQRVDVVWCDKRDGNDEIYYKGNPTGNVGIKNINSNISDKCYLYQNYPNPFNPNTKIRFEIAKSVKGQTTNAKLVIYDILGSEVTTIVNGKLTAGVYEVEWNGANYPSGVYYYKLMAGNYSGTRKMVVVK